MKRRKSSACTIDLEHAIKEFESYLDQFDRSQERIKLKIVHTYGVVDSARKIAHMMNLDEENTSLAELIALLHDIGRFEQARLYDDFDPRLMDHAQFGVMLLFQPYLVDGKGNEEIFLRRFLADDTWDDIIREAINRHSRYNPGIMEDPQMMFHIQMIRDADKLDNCRVKLEESVEVLLNMSAEEAGKQEITNLVWESCEKKESVRSLERKTMMDRWVSYLAYFYDINFRETYEIIQKERYVDMLIDRIPYTNQRTKEKMEELRLRMNEYIDLVVKEGMRIKLDKLGEVH